MRILLEHGAHITARNLSPIFPAIRIQCLETVTNLLDTVVDPNIVDYSADKEEFQLHNTIKDVTRSALLCAALSNLHNLDF